MGTLARGRAHLALCMRHIHIHAGPLPPVADSSPFPLKHSGTKHALRTFPFFVFLTKCFCGSSIFALQPSLTFYFLDAISRLLLFWSA